MERIDYSQLPFHEIERRARSIQPGEWAVEPDRPLATLLGSCVAVCLVDPLSRIGGLNHFMLPSTSRAAHDDIDSPLFGSSAMETLLDALLQRGAKKVRLQAKAFGGGAIIDGGGAAMRVGLRNADFTRKWLARRGIPLLAADFLGPWRRKVLFLPATGEVFCRRMLTSIAPGAVIVGDEACQAAPHTGEDQSGATTSGAAG